MPTLPEVARLSTPTLIGQSGSVNTMNDGKEQIIVLVIKELIKLVICEVIKRLGGGFLLNNLLVKTLISALAELAAVMTRKLLKVKLNKKGQ